MNSATDNVDPRELEKFETASNDWWDPKGHFKPLHVMNPVRLRFVHGYLDLPGRRILDVGCGGGIFSEALAGAGASVVGIDVSTGAIDAARAHLQQQQDIRIEYIHSTLKDYIGTDPRPFDGITCMELLEHVPDPAALLAECAELLTAGGHLVLATINRTLQSYLAAIVGAEYVLRLLPRGTHDYARFIKPAELGRWLRAAGFDVIDMAGMTYLPWLDSCSLSHNTAVNYLVYARLRE